SSSAATPTSRPRWSSPPTPRSSRWPSRASRFPRPAFCKKRGREGERERDSGMMTWLTAGAHVSSTSLSPPLPLSLSPPLLWAASDAAFPRGPGLYFSLLKLLPLLVVYFFWVRTCWWADQDARKLKLPHETWNPILLGSGVLGLVV